jgi:diacylglycerol kinase family enzyme
MQGEYRVHIGVIVNTKSGRNRASKLAQRCTTLLQARGHTETRIEPRNLHEFGSTFSEFDRLIIIGGDGTVHHTLPYLIEHQISFIHLATGTSNLISKELGMPKNPEETIRWIEQGGSTKIDVPTLDGVPFLIMCNFGMDASVIHRFESSRTKSGGFRNYIRPIAAETFNPQPASIHVRVDGKPLQLNRTSNLLIANMRSYALGLNPCNSADPTDSKLDILASNCRYTTTWSLQGMLARLRMPIIASQRATATQIQVAGAHTESCVQVDGEIARTPSMPNGILRPEQEIIISLGNDHVSALTCPI